ncbi:MAG TPA: rhamnogalacturonan acetylesterase [Opitutaceae bacterium]|nr:rhamnogalacturonan acetylesterase [Opitutaceae bacterium]
MTSFLVRFLFTFGLSGASLGAQSEPPRAPDLPARPAPAAAPSVPKLDPTLPTIFIAGDSTAARGKGESQQGWGVPFADYFDAGKVNIVNRARGGRSSRTFITEGMWDGLLADVKEGDLVLIQFGHNDNGALNDEPPPPLRARGTIPGLGEETKEIDNVITKKHEVVHTFGWYLRKMIADVKGKKATPVVLSPTARNRWIDGKLERGLGRYGQWTYEIAKTANVPFIDVSNVLADQFEPLGEARLKETYYVEDFVHYNAAGADLHAAAVVAGLKGWRIATVRNALSEKGTAVEAERSAWLRLPRPADPKLPSLFLIGDSTVRNGQDDGQNKGAEGQWGWGNPIAAYFDPAKINVVNRAVGGLSSRTFLTGGHWERALALMKPGDFLMIQLGTNDGGNVSDTSRARASIKGVGAETEEIENQLTKKHEVVLTFGGYLRKYIADARAKGVTPILCSLIPRKIWDDAGHIKRDKDTYAGWTAKVAQQENVGFIDLNEWVARTHDELGREAVMKLFPQVTPDEHTHPNWAGADLDAQLVVAGAKALPGNPLKAYFSEKAAAIQPRAAE